MVIKEHEKCKPTLNHLLSTAQCFDTSLSLWWINTATLNILIVNITLVKMQPRPGFNGPPAPGGPGMLAQQSPRPPTAYSPRGGPPNPIKRSATDRNPPPVQPPKK